MLATGFLRAMDITSTARNPGAALRGEKLLAGALLESAIRDLCYGSDRVEQEAREWIETGDSGKMSFDFCCQVLGYDARAIRERLLSRSALERFRSELLRQPPHDENGKWLDMA